MAGPCLFSSRLFLPFLSAPILQPVACCGAGCAGGIFHVLKLIITCCWFETVWSATTSLYNKCGGKAGRVEVGKADSKSFVGNTDYYIFL